MKETYLQRFRTALSEKVDVNDQAWSDLSQCFKLRELEQNAFLLKAGEPAQSIAFVVSGAFREFFITAKGGEFNKAFIFQNDMTGSLADLLDGGPSLASIQALTQSEVLIASYQDLVALYEIHPCLEKLGRIAAEEIVKKKALREYELLTMDALSRYKGLLAQYPDIESKIPQYHLASYLGITPVALSRMRKDLSA